MPSHPPARGSRRAIPPRRRHRPRIEALETRQLLAVDFRSVVGVEAARIEGRATAVDADGNSYVAGMFAGTADFDPGNASTLLTGSGPGDGFVAKYSPAGALVWARSFGGPGLVEATALQLDGSGNVILAGNFDGTADFDPGAGTANLTADGSTDGFVLKLSPAGAYVWSAKLGGPGSLRVAGLSLGPVGELYLVGAFTGTADLDPAAVHTDGSDLLTSLGATDGFAAKFTASGTFGWASRLGGASVDEATSVEQQGPHVIVGGTFSGAVDFDARSYAASWETSSGGSDDGYVTWLTTDGVFVKVWTLGGAGPDRVTGVGADAAGNVYVAGSFAGTADFAPKQTVDGSKDLLASVGPEDAFVARLDYGGTFGWVRRFGGAAGSRTTALAVDASGVSAAGWFRGTGVVFDAIPDSTRALTLSSRGERDGFALHLGTQGNLAWARSLGGEADDSPRAVAAQRSGQVTVTGETLGPASFGTRTIAAAGQSLFATRLIETSDDYDGDGLADVATYRPSTGQWAILPSNTGLLRLDNPIVTPVAGDRPVPLDYDGDGKTAKAVYRPSSSRWFILRSSDNLLVDIQFGQGTLYGGNPVPIVGDFDGDGRSDVGVFERSTATFNLRRSREGNIPYQFGQGTIYAGNPVPVVGDFDGDFRCDYGVYQPASLSIDRHSSSEGDSRITFDPATSYGANPVPLVGDFDGDGRADVGLFGPAESKFWVRQPSGVQTVTQFGQGTLYGGTPRPVIADYDFDGRSDFGVYQRVKPAGAQWNWALSQSGGVNRATSLGQDNDIPLPPPAEVPTTSGSIAGPATFGGDGGLALTLDGGWGPDPGTSGYVPPSGGGGTPQTPPMVTVRFASPYLTVDEGTSGKLVLLRSITGGTLDNITTEVRLSIVTPLDASLATKAVDYTSNVLQSVAEYQVIFGPGITSKDIDFNALADDLTNEGNQGVLLQIGSLRSTNYAQSQVGTPSEGEFFIPEYPPPTDGSTGGGSTGGGSTGGGSTGGGSTGGGSTGGGSTGGGSTGTTTEPVPSFGPASVVLNDNADFLSTGESPLGITDGPVWIGASSGDVLVSPNRIATRGAGHLPE